MFKKKTIGILIIGVIGIILGIFSLLSHVYDLFSYCKGTYVLVKQPLWNFILREIIGIAFSAAIVVSSICVIRLINWARKLFICLSALDLLSKLFSTIIIVIILPFGKYGFLREIGGGIVEYSSSLSFFEYSFIAITQFFVWCNFFLSIALPIFFIFYLSRHKIKEQFNKS